jgi:heme A synthase
MASSRFRLFSWGALLFVLAVILWGAVVRATGSGAGCGSHWPTCNGAVVPPAAGAKTLIEYTHRLTSGLSALLVWGQAAWAWRLFRAGDPVRRAAAWSAFFMLTEVLVGAGIVLLEYVADDKSVGRAVWMALHLCNTFLLVGAMALTAHHAGGAPRMRLRGQGGLALASAVALVGTMLVGASGAVAALGDTLFPAKDLAAGLAADLSPTAHLLVRLRVVHPFAAVAVAMFLLGLRFWLVVRRPGPVVARWGLALRVAVVAQVVGGFVNLMLLAPTWMQLVHLLLADAVWIALVLLVASALAEPQAAAEPGDAALAPV